MSQQSKDFLPVSQKIFSKLNVSSITSVLYSVLELREPRLDENTLRALVNETENLTNLNVPDVLPVEKLTQVLNILIYHLDGYRDVSKIIKLNACICICNILSLAKIARHNFVESILNCLDGCLLPKLQHVIKLKRIDVLEEYVSLLEKLLLKLSNLFTDQKLVIRIPPKLIYTLPCLLIFTEQQLNKAIFILLAAIYKNEPDYREDILHHITSNTRGFPYTRLYKVGGEEIYFTTVAFMQILHTLAYPYGYVNIEKKSDTILNEIEQTINEFIKIISMSLPNYITCEFVIKDLLTLCCNPHWPGAEKTLKHYVKHLHDVAMSEYVENAVLLPILDLLANLGVTILKFRNVGQSFERKCKDMFGLQNADVNAVKEACEKHLITYLYKKKMRGELVFNVVDFLKEKSKSKKFMKFAQEVMDNFVQFNDSHGLFKSAELSKGYLFFKASNKFLESIFAVIFNTLNDSQVILRSKALKALGALIVVEPSIFDRQDVISELELALEDEMPLMRESAVDLIGKKDSLEHVDQFYNVLLKRLDDTGYAVRKTALKVLSKFCLTYPTYEKTFNIVSCILSKLSENLNTQTGFLEVIVKIMWPENENEVAIKTDIIFQHLSASSTNAENFETVLKKIFSYKEKDAAFKVGTSIIIASLMQKAKQIGLNFNEEKHTKYYTVLKLLSKIQAHILKPHFKILLHIFLEAPSDLQLNSKACALLLTTLLNIIPLVKNLTDTARIENKVQSMISIYGNEIIEKSIDLLAFVVNNHSKNYLIVQEMFQKFFAYVENKESSDVNLRRGIFVCSLLIKSFNFKSDQVAGSLTIFMPDKLFTLLLSMLKNNSETKKCVVVVGLRHICQKHNDYWLHSELKLAYKSILGCDTVGDTLKERILWGMDEYFKEEAKYTKCDWSKKSIKEMDFASGISSDICQAYKDCLTYCCLSKNAQIRLICVNIFHQIVMQGLTHPIHVLEYLIALSTDHVQFNAKSSIKLMEEVERKIPGTLFTKTHFGLRSSYRLQQILQGEEPKGYRDDQSAVNESLYNLVCKTRKGFRSMITYVLKIFHDLQNKSSYEFLCYLAENIAFFPYNILDEVLFVMYQINTVVTIVLTQIMQKISDEIDVFDSKKSMESIFSNLPPKTLNNVINLFNMFNGCVTLSHVKEYLGKRYNVTEQLLETYNTQFSMKKYEKTLKKNLKVNYNVQRLEKLDVVPQFERLKSHLELMLSGEDMEEYITSTKAIRDVPMEISENKENETPKTDSERKRKSKIVKRKTPKKPRRKLFGSDEEYDSDYAP